MFKNLFKTIYYFLFDILAFFRNLDQKYNFIIITPRLFSKLTKKSLIFDKLNNKMFFQNIRNDFDLITIHEIFSDESYNLRNFKIWSKINEKFNGYFQNNNTPLIIDCGSNIGSSSEYFRRVYKNAEIIMIEPDKNNLEFSKKNVSIKSEFYVNKAISSEEKILKFSNKSEDNRAFKVTNNGNLEIESTTVQNLLDITGENLKPFLIKIDIEGYEKNLFEKNFMWFKNFDIIIIELHDWMLPSKHNSKNFFSAFYKTINDEINYDFLVSGENLILIKNDTNKNK